MIAATYETWRQQYLHRTFLRLCLQAQRQPRRTVDDFYFDSSRFRRSLDCSDAGATRHPYLKRIEHSEAADTSATYSDVDIAIIGLKPRRRTLEGSLGIIFSGMESCAGRYMERASDGHSVCLSKVRLLGMQPSGWCGHCRVLGELGLVSEGIHGGGIRVWFWWLEDVRSRGHVAPRCVRFHGWRKRGFERGEVILVLSGESGPVLRLSGAHLLAAGCSHNSTSIELIKKRMAQTHITNLLNFIAADFLSSSSIATHLLLPSRPPSPLRNLTKSQRQRRPNRVLFPIRYKAIIIARNFSILFFIRALSLRRPLC